MSEMDPVGGAAAVPMVGSAQRLLLAGCLATALTACGDAGQPAIEPPAATVPSLPDSVAATAPPAEPLPVDRTAGEAWPEISEWGLRDSLAVDLDGDGSEEQVILAAAVEADDRGRPMWDDGQRWAVVVLDASGDPTLIYDRFVQLGRVEVAILEAAGENRLLVAERGPNGEFAWEIAWHGAQEAEMLDGIGGALRSPEGRIALPE